MAAFELRRATVADADLLAQHRAGMFKDMHLLTDGVTEEFVAESTAFFSTSLTDGRWFGWIAEAEGKPIGGGVLHLDLMPPRNGPTGALIPARPQGLIMNVYVEPEWRRKGVATALLDAMQTFAKELGAASVTLHASAAGKPLYEKLGYAPTHEMRKFL